MKVTDQIVAMRAPEPIPFKKSSPRLIATCVMQGVNT
jgi:hypothetical protein